MYSSARIASVTLLGILFVGCADVQEQVTSPSKPSYTSAAQLSPSVHTNIQKLAELLAVGLGNPAVRVEIQNAMRSSPLTEHKLVLQDWAKAPDGQRVLQAASDASGTSVADIVSIIDRLPRMDFYFPVREHRLRWRASDPVVVVATLDPKEGAVVGYRADRSKKTYYRTDGVPAEAILMLHPAEHKGYRLNRQRNSIGDVIQDPEDGELSITLLQQCDDEAVEECGDDSGGGGGGSPSSGTFFEGFLFTEFADTEWGDEEVEFRAQLKSGSCGGCTVASKTLRYTGVNAGAGLGQYYDKFDLLFSQRITDASYWVVIKAYETDTFSDDYYGERTWYYSDFQSGSGFATKTWGSTYECPWLPNSICTNPTIVADLRVTPWP